MLLTRTGYDWAAEMPNWPYSLLPQHLVEPAESMAQVCLSPASTAAKKPDTKVGDDFEVVEPSPSCP
jgi:hypothetical protein